jgi:hypothetical protein
MVLDMALGKVRTTLRGAIEAASSSIKKIAAIAGLLQRWAQHKAFAAIRRFRGNSIRANGGAISPVATANYGAGD